MTVNTAGTFEKNVELPGKAVSSVVEVQPTEVGNVKSDISKTVVGGLDEIAKNTEVSGTDKVTIKLTGEDGKYLTMQDGKLTLSNEAFAWTYKNSAFSTSVKSEQKSGGYWFGFIYIPGRGSKTVTTTYYLSTVTDGAKLSTNCVKAELYEEVTGEHEYGCWIDCKDGANHKHICKNCGKVETKAHEYDNNTHKCVCVAYDPTQSSVKISVDVKEKTTKQYVGWWFWGTWKNVTTYTATIKTEATGVKVNKVQYQLNGGRWTTGTCVSSDKPINTLKVKVWDNNGKLYEYTYPGN